MRRAWLTGLLAGTALLAGPIGAAHAASIVFVRGGDVWLTTPDGSREHRVTATGGFANATQADDGTIVAVKDGALHRMDRSGALLNPPFRVQAYAAWGGRLDTTPLDPDLSPDGTKLAYWVMSTCTPSSGFIAETCVRTQITDSHQPSDALEPYGTQTGWRLTWITNDRILYSNNGGYINTIGFGSASWETWFEYGDGAMTNASAITRAQDKVAVVGAQALDAGAWSYGMRFFSTNGPPPAQPTARCTRDHGTDEPSRLTWSPDGAGLAWQDSGGVRIVPAVDLDNCGAAPAVTIPGATSPDWGPAGLPAAASGPRPVAPAGPVGKKPGAALSSVAVVKRQTLRTVLRRGLRVRATCAAACTVNATARVKRTVVAEARRKLRAGRAATLVLKPTAKGRRLLRRTRKAKVAITLKVTAPGQPAQTRTVSATLRR